MAGSDFRRRGELGVWLAAASLTLVILMTCGFFLLIIINGLKALWPDDVASIVTVSGQTFAGEVTRRETRDGELQRLQIKTANRDLYGFDFKWIEADTIIQISFPPAIYIVERVEYGDFIGYPVQEIGNVKELQEKVAELTTAIDLMHTRIGTYNDLLRAEEKKASPDRTQITNYRQSIAAVDTELTELEQRRDRYRMRFVTADGQEKDLLLADVIRLHQPNAMSVLTKTIHYLIKIGELLTDSPREANTEGGVFPAAFGTILMVFIMSITSFPFGVLAGIYLGVYARGGFLLKLVRIAVNNLAGIPSIVFGIFGLGFFIYGLGAGIDDLFFASTLPEPTFGTGGILWASLTLGLLTMPVVIVATEEALSSIPAAFRDSSLAIGATPFQTLYRVLLPIASPGILTGFILAMARAAGEVAPLMITGVVKLAPSLAIDGSFPFLHLDRKFMHLGFHIYDISCQSPNVEAAKPLVYATTLLLILIVLLMTGGSIWLRNGLRKKYGGA